MARIYSLINALKAKKINVSDLNWDEFQKIVFHLIVAENSGIWKNPVIVTDYTVGEIDMIIKTQHPPSLKLGKKILKTDTELHFIECKYHSKKISFDVAARVFCAGILHKPKNLIIVSNKPLYPQAIEYANKFFLTDTSNGMFNQINFYRTSLEELLGLETLPLFTIETAKTEEIKYEITDWELIEESTFSQKLISSLNYPIALKNIDSSLKYKLRIWINGVKVLNQKELKLFLFLPSYGNLVILNSKQIKYYRGGELSIECYLNKSSFQKIQDNLFVRIMSNSRDDLIGAIKLPKLKLNEQRVIFEDFRERETKNYAKKISQDSNSKIIFVHGEGGVGKSFFCEQVSKLLKLNYGYTAYQFTIDEDTSILAFMQFIWPLLSSFQDGKINPVADDKIGNEVLKAFIKGALEEENIIESEEFVKKITKLKLQDLDIEIFLLVCAKVIVKSITPIVILIRDCHKLSPVLVKNFRTLFKIIDDLGWGNAQFLLEYRDTQEEVNDYWKNFIQEILRDLKIKCEDCEIKPLSRKELNVCLKGIFVGEDSIKSEILLKKTGGNPLFLTQLIEYFINLGFIEKVVYKDNLLKLNIVDVGGVEQELLGIPKTVESFLERRVNKYFEKIKDKTQKELIISYLGLSSVIGYQINEYKLKEALYIGDAELKNIRFKLISDNLLNPSYTTPPAVFVHEMMQIAVKEVSKKLTEFQCAALKLEGILKQEVTEDAIIGGKLNFELLNLKEAYEWFNIGYEIEKKIGNYSLQRICLQYLKRILEKNESQISNHIEKYFSICLALGWNEFHNSSLINSIKVYKDIIEKLKDEQITQGLTDGVKHIFKIEAIHNLLTVYVDLFWIKESIETFYEEISIVDNADRFLYLINRFILFCSRSNYPEYGWKAYQLIYEFKSKKYPNQIWSVLCSDIGHLYLESNPKIALKIWEEGLKYAEDIRQINHSRLNILVCKLHLNSFGIKPLNRLNIDEKSIFNQGIEGQIVRLNMYKGITTLYDKDKELANHYFKKALNSSVRSNLKIQEWQCHNNLAVLSLFQGYNEVAIDHFEKAAIIISKTITFYDENCLEVEKLFDELELKFKNLTKNNKQTKYIKKESGVLEKSPEISGSYNYLVYNIYVLSDLLRVEKIETILKHLGQPKFDKKKCALFEYVAHPLLVNCGGKPFALILD